MSKRSVSMFVLLFVLLFAVGCGEQASSKDGKSESVAPESNLTEIYSGVPSPDASNLKEVRDAFIVNEEKIAVQARWKAVKQDYKADFIWIDPEGKKIYSKTMDMKKEWTRALVHYRGEMPLEAGKWTVEIRVGGKLYGTTSFTAVRERSKVPFLAQIDSFKTEKISLEEAQLIAEKIRCFSDKKCDEASVLDIPETLAKKKVGLSVSLFRNAKLTDVAFASAGTMADSLKELMKNIKAVESAPASMELSIIHSQLELTKPSESLINAKMRAGMGFSLTKEGKSAAILPTQIVRNQVEEGLGVVRQLSVDAGLPENAWKEGKLTAFMTQDFLLGEKMEKAEPLAFSRTVVPVADVTRQDLVNAVDAAMGWYLRNQISEGEQAGRYMYTFFVSKDLEPNEDWGLRNLNAIFVLAEIAKDKKDPKLIESVKRAIDVFAKYLKPNKNGKGRYLDWPFPRKVHSIAGTAFLLGAMAELGIPGYEADMKDMADAIISLQEESGKLITDFFPPYRDIDQEYYPGETLLALMRYYKLTKYQPALDCVVKAYPFYQNYWNDDEIWKGENMSRAPFVPWQVRAYQEAYTVTKDKRYADFAFQMIDWMLGRYKPLREGDAVPGRVGALSSQFASTGVYGEGLSAAVRLTREVKDKEREEQYTQALRGMMGYVLGLQYKENDMYWIARPGKVLGALAMRPDNDELRLDATYHAISAVHYTTKLFTDEQWKAIVWK